MMDTVIYNLICYTVELSKLLLVSAGFLGIPIKARQTVLSVSAISFLLLMGISLRANLPDYSFLYGLLAIGCTFFSLQEKKKIPVILIVYVYICILDMILNSICMFSFGLTVEKTQETPALYIVLNMLSMLIFIPALLLKFRRHKTLRYTFSRRYSITLLLGGLSLSLYLASIQLFAFEDISKRHLKLAGLALSVCSIAFLVISVMLLENKMQNRLLKQQNETVTNLMKAQENYYTMLLHKETETRAFRHDIQSHLYCMQMLYRDGKTAEFEDYLSKLTASLHELKAGLDTGNRLVNVIANDIFSRYETVELTWAGHLPDTLKISTMDLCTVFTNILKNAAEAAAEAADKQVTVSVRVLESNLFVCVVNHTTTAPVAQDGVYISAKPGAGHGYGIRNVQHCLEKNGGSFALLHQDDIVTTEVVFPNAIES